MYWRGIYVALIGFKNKKASENTREKNASVPNFFYLFIMFSV